MTKTFGLFPVLILISMLVPKMAIACSCVPLTGPQMFDRAEKVFVARLVGKEIIRDSAENVLNVKYRLKFEVTEVLKGNIDEVRYLSHDSSIGCGITPGITGELLDLYLVFEKGDIWTNHCAGTRRLESLYADPLLKELRDYRDKRVHSPI